MQLDNAALETDGVQNQPFETTIGIPSQKHIFVELYPWVLSFTIVIGLALHLWHTPIFLESMDAVLFSQGLERYSLPELRLQWPGYVVYSAIRNDQHIDTSSDP